MRSPYLGVQNHVFTGRLVWWMEISCVFLVQQEGRLQGLTFPEDRLLLLGQWLWDQWVQRVILIFYYVCLNEHLVNLILHVLTKNS